MSLRGPERVWFARWGAGRVAAVAAIAALALAGGWTLFVGLPRWSASRSTATPATPAGNPVAERKITATLYYISEDGLSLVGTQREVRFAESVAEQARRILEAQLGGAPQPLSSPIPESTSLRALFLSEKGDAYVDLSVDARVRHTGGALDELFTIYAIVNALTVNLPAISRVQILVDGKEVDTLAGHVDLRHPLQKNLKWVRTDGQTDVGQQAKDGS
jgi:spore germination protein GerM